MVLPASEPLVRNAFAAVELLLEGFEVGVGLRLVDGEALVVGEVGRTVGLDVCAVPAP
jgi:hypothetical protein